MMNTSYGLVEVSGVVAAVDSLDAMCKAAEVRLVTWERKLGGRLVTLIVEGGVADAKAAVEAAVHICKENHYIMASYGIIAAPSDEIRRIVALSARRLEAPGQKAEIQEEAAETQEKAAEAQEKTAEAQEGTAEVQEKTAKAQEGTAEVQENTAKAQENTAEAHVAGTQAQTEAAEAHVADARAQKGNVREKK